MSNDVLKVLDSALKLSQEDRAAIAERLISSLDRTVDDDVEISWQKEIEKRVHEIQSGAIVMIPWEEARKRLRG